MRFLYIGLILINISWVKASDENEIFVDNASQENLNDQNFETDSTSSAIDQDSLDVISPTTDQDVKSSRRLIELENQVQNLQTQLEDLKKSIIKPTSLDSSFDIKSEDTKDLGEDSMSDSIFDSRPALKSYEQAQKFLEDQDYSEAEKTLKDIINNYPDDPLVINAKYWLGETYFLQKKYKQAAQHFAHSYEVYLTMLEKKDLKKQKLFKMSFSKAPEALIKLAQCFKILKKNKQACMTLAQIQNEFPQATPTIKKSVEKLEHDIQCKKSTVESN